jgi:hypothetical protein
MLYSRNYIIILPFCILLVSCYSKETRLKKQIKMWNERIKSAVPDTSSFLKRIKDSIPKTDYGDGNRALRKGLSDIIGAHSGGPHVNF